MKRLPQRLALTVIETIVVIGIIAVLFALLLPAILRIRDAAAIVESSNKLRQLAIALHHFDSDKGKLPRVNRSPGIFRGLMPYLEEDNALKQSTLKGNNHIIRAFVSPSDPTMSPMMHGVTSYAANAQIFSRKRRLSNGIRDGLSNTISFTEHYAYRIQDTDFSWFDITSQLTGTFPELPAIPQFHERPGTFADNGPEVLPYRPIYVPASSEVKLNDIYPVYDPTTRLTVASVRGMTFQVRPSIESADPRIPQTPHNSLIAAMMDGSVRKIGRYVTESTFWSSVSPNAGDVLGNDWND